LYDYTGVYISPYSLLSPVLYTARVILGTVITIKEITAQTEDRALAENRTITGELCETICDSGESIVLAVAVVSCGGSLLVDTFTDDSFVEDLMGLVKPSVVCPIAMMIFGVYSTLVTPALCDNMCEEARSRMPPVKDMLPPLAITAGIYTLYNNMFSSEEYSLYITNPNGCKVDVQMRYQGGVVTQYGLTKLDGDTYEKKCRDCAKKCYDNTNCNFWTFDADTDVRFQGCFLYRNEVITSTNQKTTATSGESKCGGPAAFPKAAAASSKDTQGFKEVQGKKNTKPVPDDYHICGPKCDVAKATQKCIEMRKTERGQYENIETVYGVTVNYDWKAKKDLCEDANEKKELIYYVTDERPCWRFKNYGCVDYDEGKCSPYLAQSTGHRCGNLVKEKWN